MSAVLDAPLAQTSAPVLDRAAIRDFFDLYYDCLDSVRLEEWPELFTAECLYRVIPRENYERGYTLCTMQAESRGMLQDRVTGLLRTQMFAPRTYRRFPGPLRLIGPEKSGSDAGGLRVRHNLLMVQTLLDKQTDIVLAGTCHDLVVVDEGQLRLRERIVVFDSEMVPNSLVYPA